MTRVVEAIYEHGILRLKEPLPLAEGSILEVTLEGAFEEPVPPHTKSPAEILAEIAALPVEPGEAMFSGRDHDRILYGERDAK